MSRPLRLDGALKGFSMAELIPLTPMTTNAASIPTPVSSNSPASPSVGIPPRARRPEWLRARMPAGENYEDVRDLMREKRLHTVCEEARCPNIGECWNHRTATFLLLGEVCTRGCRYCAIAKGKPGAIDENEPERIAEAVEHLKLRHAVLTAVNRDDQPDGGAHIFAASIHKIRERLPECKIEVLIPDFDGNWDALKLVMDAQPDVLNHNIETVPQDFSALPPAGRLPPVAGAAGARAHARRAEDGDQERADGRRRREQRRGASSDGRPARRRCGCDHDRPVPGARPARTGRSTAS